MRNVQHVAWPKCCYRNTQYSRTRLIGTLVIRITNCLDLLCPSGKLFFTVLALHILWLKLFLKLLNTYEKLSIKVPFSVNKYVAYNRRLQKLFCTSSCQYSLFSKINPVIRFFCISEYFPVPTNPDTWSSTVSYLLHNILVYWH